LTWKLTVNVGALQGTQSAELFEFTIIKSKLWKWKGWHHKSYLFFTASHYSW